MINNDLPFEKGIIVFQVQYWFLNFKSKIGGKIFFRTKIFQILLCTFFNISCILLINGILVAQSLLGDRAFLQEFIDNSVKVGYKSRNLSILPSDLFFNPKITYKNKKVPEIIGLPKHSKSSKNHHKMSIPPIREEFKERIITESTLMKLFPWFSGLEPSSFANANDDRLNYLGKKELADIEFNGILMWVSYLQKLLISNPEKARLKFLEIEDKLEVEDRTLLKVQLFYFLNEWLKAENLAEAFLREKHESKNTPLIFYYLNKSLLAQEKLLNQDPIFRKLTIKFLEPKLLSDYFQILSNDAAIRGDVFSSVKYRIEELKNKETSKYSDKSKLLRLLRDLKSIAKLQIISEKYPNLVWLQEQIPLIKIELFLEKSRYREALGIVESRLDLAQKKRDKEQIEFFYKIQKRLTRSIKINPKKIGVVLPLSSSNIKIARLAQETLNGLWIALHAIEKSVRKPDKVDSRKSKRNKTPITSKKSVIRGPHLKNEGSWELIIRDSHLNAEITKKVIHELVEKENVIAIIGPLARKTSEAAAGVAEMLRVPLISLSLTDSIPKLGDYIFRNNKSWKQEVSELLDYAVSELQACRFVVLFSKTREGRHKMRHFWDGALKKGCEIVAVEGFKYEGQKSLVNEFDTFTGKNLYMDIEEKNILRELKEKEDPIHNFDAVFVAVGSGGAKNLRLIFPYSSVYKMEKIAFLGDSGWNDLAIQFAPGIRGVRRPIFVDSFFSGIKTNEMKMLLNLHERILYRHQNYIGPTAYTAFAYDTLMLLLNLIKEKQIQNHKELQEALLNMEPYPSVTGNLNFNKFGEIQRGLKFLTLRGGEIQPLILDEK